MKKKLLRIILAFIIIGGIALIWGYTQLFSANTGFTEDSRILLIRNKMNISELTEWLVSENIIDNANSFQLACRLKRFQELKKPGRFEVKKGWSNQTLINTIRSGNQSPVNIRFGSEKSLEELAGKLGEVLMFDSADFASTFHRAILSNDYNINEDQFACFFLADTYQEFWTVDPESFLKRMIKNFDQYWSDENKEIASNLGLNPFEATILASIVKGETGKMEEAPKIAGLYLNRLKIGMPLQADPTALYGAGAQNVDRVTNEINVRSRYNTYDFVGLPPGPIAFVERAFLDAVLHPSSHDFLFMCAKPDLSGFHNFSKTYEQHLQFAAEYHRSLDARGIK